MARERFDERRVFQIVLDAYEHLLAEHPEYTPPRGSHPS